MHHTGMAGPRREMALAVAVRGAMEVRGLVICTLARRVRAAVVQASMSTVGKEEGGLAGWEQVGPAAGTVGLHQMVERAQHSVPLAGLRAQALAPLEASAIQVV